MAKIITVTIKDGQTSVDLEGFHGEGCKAIAEAFKEIGQVTKDITKPEYHQKAVKQVCQ